MERGVARGLKLTPLRLLNTPSRFSVVPTTSTSTRPTTQSSDSIGPPMSAQGRPRITTAGWRLAETVEVEAAPIQMIMRTAPYPRGLTGQRSDPDARQNRLTCRPDRRA